VPKVATSDCPIEIEIFNVFARDCGEIFFYHFTPISITGDAPSAFDQTIVSSPDGDFTWILRPGMALYFRGPDGLLVPENLSLLEFLLQLILTAFVINRTQTPRQLTAALDPWPHAAPPEIGALMRLPLPAAHGPFFQPSFYFAQNVVAIAETVENCLVLSLAGSDATDLAPYRAPLQAMGFQLDFPHDRRSVGRRQAQRRRRFIANLMGVFALLFTIFPHSSPSPTGVGRTWHLGFPVDSATITYGTLNADETEPSFHFRVASPPFLAFTNPIVGMAVFLFLWQLHGKLFPRRRPAPLAEREGTTSR
jgi:hypothetical protein